LLCISLSPAKQIGVRMALPALGFGIAFVGAELGRGRAGRGVRLLTGLLLGWYAGNALLAYPHYLPYFNELAGGPRLPHQGHFYLADSNLDWGQDLIRLAQWQREKNVPELWLDLGGLVDPAVYGIRFRFSDCRPERGWHAVSVNMVLGLDEFRGQRECYALFHSRKPVDRVGASIWIYRLP
jgi:hypothetical protein